MIGLIEEKLHVGSIVKEGAKVHGDQSVGVFLNVQPGVVIFDNMRVLTCRPHSSVKVSPFIIPLNFGGAKRGALA
ncbi:MAG: hypothetical protein JKY17_00915 [Magnetovibrio sp.]|nr:hypothetical protein [Magnetovibrio sp.]